MLQFIVLGYIPGTSIQLTFVEILLIAGCISLGIYGTSYWIRHQAERTARQLMLRFITN